MIEFLAVLAVSMGSHFSLALPFQSRAVTPAQCLSFFQNFVRSEKAQIAVDQGLQYIENFRKIPSENSQALISEGRRRLAIPPSYQLKWLSPNSESHLQAVALNTQNQFHYYYHPRWDEAVSKIKHERALRLGEGLEKLEGRLREEIKSSAFTKEKVSAVLLALMSQTAIRMGNRESATEKKTFGLTTLFKTHVETSDHQLFLSFVGKSNKAHRVEVRDPELRLQIRELLKTPGEELFRYQDSQREWHTINSTQVNDRLRELSRENFSGKDFRNWQATWTAYLKLISSTTENLSEAKSLWREAVKLASEQLGNTPSICESTYIHPELKTLFFKNFREFSKKSDSRTELIQTLKGLDKNEEDLTP